MTLTVPRQAEHGTGSAGCSSSAAAIARRA
jgi:hypothetical protein